MNKLGYKQKGIPMLKSPVKAVNPLDPKNLKVVDLVAKGKAGKKAKEEKAAKTASNRATTMDEILTPFKSGESAGYNSYRNRRKEVLATKKEVFSKANNSNPKSFRELSNFPKPANPFDSVTVEGVKIGSLNSAPKNDPPPPPPPPPKVKTSFKDAYAKRDMKTYGNLSQAEFTTEAKRQLKGGKVPGSQMKGGSTRKKVNSVNAGIKAQNKLLDSGAARTSQIPTPGKAERKDILDSNASKATASRIGKSRKDIRKEKRANIKGGMSRQEARLKKTQSKAASAKAKTNRTIKSIDPTKAKSADTGAKQTSARTTRAKAKRLEKRAKKLKGRVNASKVSK